MQFRIAKNKICPFFPRRNGQPLNLMKISIVTTTMNSGATLRDTMMSVLAQSYQDFEHIIVDGVSTDNTLDIIKELEPLYNGRLKYISEKDKGIYDAMNKGISLATGDVIGTLNSDDFFTTAESLNIIAKNIENVDACYGDVHFIKDNDLNKVVRYYSGRTFSRWQMSLGLMPPHPTFYCRREVYDRLGIFDIDMILAADFDLLLRFIYINKISVRYHKTNLVTMRVGGATTSGLPGYLQVFNDSLNIYRKHRMKRLSCLLGCRYAYKLMEVWAFRLRTSPRKIMRKLMRKPIAKLTPTSYINSWSTLS